MKYFRRHILARIIILTISLCLFSYLIFVAELQASSLFIGLLIVIQIGNLIFFAEQTNRVLSRFFSGIKYDDFTTSQHQESKGKSFDELNEQLSRVVDQFRRIRMEKEENYRYLEQVFHHLSIPTISIRNGEEINFINQAGRLLFAHPGLRKLEDLDENLIKEIKEMPSGEKRMIRITRNGEVIPLIISVTAFKLQGVGYQLVSFQNIRREMEQTETDAWQKLLRVLTHEIMNSVTPVTTLAESLRSLLFQADHRTFRGPDITPDQTKDILQAIDIIRNRSKGLLSFVETYRNLTRIPVPQLEEINLSTFLNDLHRLFRTRFQNEGIEFELTIVPEKLTVWADHQMTEQVIINLIINAIHAVETRLEKHISLSAKENAFGQVRITVKDNGCGIPAERLEEIFIPFYSTKKEGSGVGLSISRQIMQAQGGEIRVSSRENEGSAFTLTFG
ncbi:MAG: ATP-binding protein [Bacteroidia bacterium]|nr:ATP-binding protein [Bacteroidia bacterium]